MSLREHYKFLHAFEEAGIHLQSEKLRNLISKETLSYNPAMHFIGVDELLRSRQSSQMADLLNIRANLDIYLSPIGFRIENNRQFILRRLVLLQQEDFLRVLNNNENDLKKHQPTDTEILLQAFIQYLFDCDRYYSQNPVAREEFFLRGFLPQPFRSQNKLQLEIRPKQIQCHIMDNSIPFLKNASGVFSLITFIIAFVQMKHSAELESLPVCAFRDLMQRFDVSN